MAWHGMAWHGMAWHGMAWHGWQLSGALTVVKPALLATSPTNPAVRAAGREKTRRLAVLVALRWSQLRRWRCGGMAMVAVSQVR